MHLTIRSQTFTVYALLIDTLWLQTESIVLLPENRQFVTRGQKSWLFDSGHETSADLQKCGCMRGGCYYLQVYDRPQTASATHTHPFDNQQTEKKKAAAKERNITKKWAKTTLIKVLVVSSLPQLSETFAKNRKLAETWKIYQGINDLVFLPWINKNNCKVFSSFVSNSVRMVLNLIWISAVNKLITICVTNWWENSGGTFRQKETKNALRHRTS